MFFLPIENVQINGPAFRRSPAKRETLERAISGPVNCLAVHPQPVADCEQALLEFGLDCAIGFWAHIQEEVSSPARDLDQGAYEISCGFEVAVVFVVSPSVVDCHAGLPQPEIFRRRHVARLCSSRPVIKIQSLTFNRYRVGQETLGRFKATRAADSII